MGKARTFAIVFFCGVFSLFAFRVLDGDDLWPDLTPMEWVIYVAGLVVITLLGFWFESRMRRRDRGTNAP